MDDLSAIREALRKLKIRRASGEIDRHEYFEIQSELLAELPPEERAALESATPAPGPVSTEVAGTPGPVGPSGGSGSGVRTTIPSLADLTLEPGVELLGQWRIGRELGRGGFGAVFEAEELHLGETQAVKVLDPAMVAREELLARFRREVQVMRRLVHPHIVRVYDYREDLDEHLALISMEYVPGGTVKDLMGISRESGDPVPVVLALRILAQVLEALVEAHGQEVVHRDVTPGNILLAGASARELLADPAQDPRAKLVDFGIAGLVERSELSQKSRVLGTAAYVAPEVLNPSAPVTPAADVYGLGAVVYELLTGTAPLGRFADPSAERPELGGEVDELLLGLLDPKPDRRPSAPVARSRSVEVIEVVQEGAWRTAEVRANAERLENAVRAGNETEVQRLLADLEDEPLATHAVTEARAWVEERRAERQARERERREAEERRRAQEREAAERRREEEERRREAEEAQRRKEKAERRERGRRDEEKRRQEAARATREESRRSAQQTSWAPSERRQREAAQALLQAEGQDSPHRGEAGQPRNLHDAGRRVSAKPTSLQPRPRLVIGVLGAAVLVALVVVNLVSNRQGTSSASQTNSPGPSIVRDHDAPLAANSKGDRLPAPPAVLEIYSNVGGGEVWIDGQPAGATPLHEEVQPGQRLVRVLRSGCEEHREQVTVEAGEVVEVAATLACPELEARQSLTAALASSDEAAVERASSALADLLGDAADGDPDFSRANEWLTDREAARWRAQIEPAGTALDLQTDLMWTKKDNGWAIDWSDAKRYCEELSLGGFADWRVPTIEELKVLDDERWPNDCFGCVRLGIEAKGWVWGSTKERGSSRLFDFAQHFSFTGQPSESSFGRKNRVRALCVREAKEAAEEMRQRRAQLEAERREEKAHKRLEAGPYGTVLDPATGLMWTKKDNGSAIKWNDSKSYCEQLPIGGFTDWRLATSDELEELFDPSVEPDDCDGHPCFVRLGIDLSQPEAWGSTMRGSSSSFDFRQGERRDGIGRRVLCVRRSEPEPS